ncbi:OsmC family protein [Curtobacterium ammoniigenes]|uniref:OsmC family protein n=1 Tax=Curtobacterium ammoniigenes TaxID=395387 RepID=UPI0009FAB427|nr:OsmC family protein [Curtobacterium ammoniigenes]
MSAHGYTVAVEWTGNRGVGTSGYREYGRDHVVSAAEKAAILGSADPTFRGDRDRWNPEEMLLAALAQCHMLSYLHAAVEAGVTVVSYHDEATASLRVHRDGSGDITEAVLRPVVTVADPEMAERATDAHERAAALCFIARSVAFPVRHEPRVEFAAQGLAD